MLAALIVGALHSQLPFYPWYCSTNTESLTTPANLDWVTAFIFWEHFAE